MADLNTQSNLSVPDNVYEMFVSLTEGCDTETALLRTNKLALILANHIGDDEIIAQAIAIAKSDRG